MDEFYRPQPQRGESQMAPSFVNRAGPSLPRRFTAESGHVPTLSSFIPGSQRPPEPTEFAATPAATLHKVQLLEKKRQEYERIRESKRRFEAELSKLDAQQRQEERELAQMAEDLQIGRFAGHQSEPTTPPEYRDASRGFPSMFSRPNRHSTGLVNRGTRSLLTSPPSGMLPMRLAFDDQLPSLSGPGSRRNSDDDEKEEAVRQDPTSHRSTKATNRYSMPVTRSRTSYDIGLEDSNNTAGFLFDDEEDTTGEGRATPTGQVSSADAFPTLFRQQGYSNRHSMSAIGSGQASGTGSVASPELTPIGTQPANVRHSLDGAKLFQESAAGSADATPSSVMSPAISNILASPPKLQQSFSANDVPTLKSTNGQSNNNHAQQHFHNHNAGLGRIPAGAMAARHTRELSGDTGLTNGRDNGGYPSITSTLHANAAPFGPVAPQQQTSATVNTGLTSTAPAMPYPYYPPGPNYTPPGNNAGYGNLPMMMQNMSVGNNNNPSAMYAPQNYTGYGALYNGGGSPRQPHDSQARVIQSRRAMDGEAMSRFNNLPLEQVVGTIYTLCKDQHGCRYLQKKLDDRNEEQIHMIWLETNQHVIELMTDPFGNYLCQKLLELCSEDERTVLIRNATPDMVRIALNAHGTRALQKMIDSVSSPVQINLIIEALRNRVVELIQDLNGNHVIQKCLNKLDATDASFIFDAVGQNCVEVGTHRHGCCVLQRCIDHADGSKKIWLIERITANAVTLVQDPFGNYVVQYIIDLNEPSFTEPLVRQFLGRIPQLSKHKFSSNVVEKCLRCASPNSKDMIVSEIMSQNEIKQLMQDSYGNYVVQTALDYATPGMKHQLVEAIRPHLPAVRATPYGRRIQAKVQTYDNQIQSGTSNSGQATPADPASGQIPLRPAQHNRAMSNNTSILNAGGVGNGANSINGGGNGRPLGAVFPASNMITVPPPAAQSQIQAIHPQNANQQQHFSPAGGAPAENGQNWV
ncbi:hypothetical protein SMAC4_02457 [Sordaria macrospora]|nr:hypothetical protein SMAC4_02457 [Sordaria macrospora]